MAAVPEPVPLEGLVELLPAPEPQQPQQVPQNPLNVVPNVAAEVIPFSAIHGHLCFFVSVCLVSYLRFISLSPGSVLSRQFLVTCLSLGLFHFGWQPRVLSSIVVACPSWLPSSPGFLSRRLFIYLRT